MAGLHGGAQNSRLSAGRRGCGGRDAGSVHTLWLPCFGSPCLAPPRLSAPYPRTRTHTTSGAARLPGPAAGGGEGGRRAGAPGPHPGAQAGGAAGLLHAGQRRSAGTRGAALRGASWYTRYSAAGASPAREGTLPASLGVGMSACPASCPAWGGPACCPTRRQWATWGTCCRAAERHRATPASDVRLRLVGPLWTLRRAAPELHAQQWCRACRGGWVQLAAQLGSPRVQPLPLTPALPVCTDNMTQLPLAPSLVACRGFNCHRRTLVFRAPEPCFQPSPPRCIE